MNQDFLELYSDYLISTFGSATAIGLASRVSGAVRHDQVTRCLSSRDDRSRDLWWQVTSTVREIEQAEAVLIFDAIQEKPWTDESALICWHVDHGQKRTVKGGTCSMPLDHSGGVAIPIDFRLIRTPLPFGAITTRRLQRAHEVAKNAVLQERFLQALITYQ